MNLATGRQTPRIAPAMQADAADAAALTRAAIAELCHADHGGDPDKIAAWCANKTPESFAAWIAAPDLLARVATGAKGLIGVLLATRKGEILLNYVATAARGRGVTTALLADAERELADLGVARARLVSTVTAREFYLRRGWRADGPEIFEFGMLGIPMAKDLPSP
jgi:GNAT superfamily N-acetyltransferase